MGIPFAVMKPVKVNTGSKKRIEPAENLCETESSMALEIVTLQVITLGLSDFVECSSAVVINLQTRNNQSKIRAIYFNGIEEFPHKYIRGWNNSSKTQSVRDWVDMSWGYRGRNRHFQNLSEDRNARCLAVIFHLAHHSFYLNQQQFRFVFVQLLQADAKPNFSSLRVS